MHPRIARASLLFLPTLKDAPADAITASHRLLVRAGFIRQVSPGHHAYLPLGTRSLHRLATIVRAALAAIGAQELRLPPGSSTGQAEAFVGLARGEVRSYRQLPQRWYEVGSPRADEERPKVGPLLARDGPVVSACSLDVDRAGLDRASEDQRQAFERVLARCGLETLLVEAHPAGAAAELVVRLDASEDQAAACSRCGYAAKLDVASSRLPPIADEQAPATPERFPTPGVTTIQALASPPHGVPPERQLKTLVYVADEQPIVAVVRGDHALSETRLRNALAAGEARPARVDEIAGLLGAHPGSLGAVGFRDARVLVDRALVGRTSMVTGANADGFHFRGVDVERDVLAFGAEVVDLRPVEIGEGCPRCEGTLAVFGVVTLGALEKVGTGPAAAVGATVLDAEGRETPIAMGSYWLDLGRLLAAVVEQRHDADGIVWPPAVAPFDVTVLTLGREPDLAEAAQTVCEALADAGLDVLYDDRDERAGVKFKDADLVGVPVRIAVGRRGLAAGGVEWKPRWRREAEVVAMSEAMERTLAALRDGPRPTR